MSVWSGLARQQGTSSWASSHQGRRSNKTSQPRVGVMHCDGVLKLHQVIQVEGRESGDYGLLVVQNDQGSNKLIGACIQHRHFGGGGINKCNEASTPVGHLHFLDKTWKYTPGSNPSVQSHKPQSIQLGMHEIANNNNNTQSGQHSPHICPH